ncbi:ArsR/SmtB family transcription factor [Janibacter sp. GS2]|uniref:ArsR/SmtB family transcription factor n=1 Tax=Janibacter sp. GS2 TaxID=3442646 RepID=UPI003EBE70A9
MSLIESDPRERAATCCGLATSPVSPEDAARLAPVFKALGDPVRLRMASMIAAQPELCVCEITPAFDLSSGTISHHLRLLREAGLVGCERRGTYVYYWINPEALAALSTLLAVQAPV